MLKAAGALPAVTGCVPLAANPAATCRVPQPQHTLSAKILRAATTTSAAKAAIVQGSNPTYLSWHKRQSVWLCMPWQDRLTCAGVGRAEGFSTTT